MKKLLAAAGCMVVVACAGGTKPATAPGAVQAGSAEPAPMGVDKKANKAELDQLYAEIEENRSTLKLPEAATPICEGAACGRPTPQALTPHPTTSTDSTCKPGKSDTCTTSCTLSDSICKNADRICTLAEQLQPDNDAAAKCEKATATCTKSHASCCSCL